MFWVGIKTIKCSFIKFSMSTTNTPASDMGYFLKRFSSKQVKNNGFSVRSDLGTRLEKHCEIKENAILTWNSCIQHEYIVQHVILLRSIAQNFLKGNALTWDKIYAQFTKHNDVIAAIFNLLYHKKKEGSNRGEPTELMIPDQWIFF